MTTIRVEFPTMPAHPALGIRGIDAAAVTAVVVEVAIPRKVRGVETRESRQTMYEGLWPSGGEA
jgi:hypothetical protein